MSGVLDTLGDIGGAALDFISPDMGRRDAGYGLGDLMKAAGDAFNVTPLGGLTQLPNLLTGDSTWGQKLLYGGLLAGGAALGAHEWHAAQKLERQALLAPLEASLERPAEATLLPAPRAMRSEIGRSVGLPARYAPGTLEGEHVLRAYPGLKARTADILGAADLSATARSLTDLTDTGRAAAAESILADYSARLTDVDPAGRLGAVQGDWAKLQVAVDHRVLTGTDNPVFIKLWKQFQESPDTMSVADRTKFVDMALSISTATRGIIQPDLSFDLVSNVSKITATEDGQVFVHLAGDRRGWTEEGLLSQKERQKRVAQLNLRQLVDRAGEIYDRILAHGETNPEKYFTQGDDWYGYAHNEIAGKLDELAGTIPNLDMERLTAAVSLTSAASEWEGNIQLAVNALGELNDPQLQTEGFQAWLRSTTGAKAPDGSAYQRSFDEIHDRLTNRIARENYDLLLAEKKAIFDGLPRAGRPAWKAWLEAQGLAKPEGNFLSADDLKKTLRLYSESGQQVLATTVGQKQKNFYINLLDPKDPEATTVDRHAFDMFFGASLQLGDGIDLNVKTLGDDQYEIIADTIRKKAAERNELANQTQGKLWTAWRVMKDEWGPYRTHTYGKGRGPFSLPEPDGSPNLVLETLAGRPNPAVKDPFDFLPNKVAYVTGGKGTGLVVLSDGSGSVATHFTREWADNLRHLYPSVQDENGVVMWARGKPLAVHDVAEVQRHLDEALVGHHADSMAADAWDSVHPAERPGVHLLLEMPEGAQLPSTTTEDNIVHPGGNGRIMASRPDLSKTLATTRLRPAQLSVDTFVDPQSSPLVTHRWAALSAAIDDDQAARFGLGEYDNAARHADLGARLREMGFEPIEQSGVYGGAPEPSWLVFGITPEQAIKIGGDFHQDAVITNDHMWYTKTAKDPTDVGKAQAFDPRKVRIGVADEDYISITPIDGQDVKWTTAYDWESPHEPVDPRSALAGDVPTRTSTPVQQLAVKLTPSQVADLERTVGKFEENGAKVSTIYAPGEPPIGWVAARDHLYQDGIGKTLIRTADRESVSQHGFTSWVREADAEGLPRTNPLNGRPKERLPATQTGSMVRYGQVAFADRDIFDPKVRQFTVDLSGQVPVFHARDGKMLEAFHDPSAAPPSDPALVRKIGDRFIITAENPLDITQQVGIQNTLHAIGVPAEKIRMNIGKDVASMNYPEPKAPRKSMLTSFGLRSRDRIRTGRPIPEILDSTGIKVDPYVRDHAGKLVKLADELVPPIHDTIKRFQDAAGEMLQLAGFEHAGLSLHPTDWFNAEGLEVPAWYQAERRGKILLNQSFWKDAGTLAAYLDENQSTGYLNPNMPRDASALFAHEMGHTVHQGLIAAFRTKGEYKVMAEKELRAIYDRLKKAGTMKREVSGYAAVSFDEFVAETVSEAIMSPNPRSAAVEVYSLVKKHFEAQRAPLKTGMGWPG